MHPITVVIPVKNRLDLTRPLVETLVGQGGYDQILVYDNGSTDQTADWLATQDAVTAIDAADWGLHDMWNDGLERTARGGCTAILNNDLALDGKPGWLQRLCAPLHESLWGSVCPNYDGRERGQHEGPVRRLHGLCNGRYDGTGGLAGFAFVVPHYIHYRFPTELRWWYGDADFVKTLDAGPFPPGMVLDVGVTHLEGGSATAKSYNLSDAIKRDRRWFERKWGQRT